MRPSLASIVSALAALAAIIALPPAAAALGVPSDCMVPGAGEFGLTLDPRPPADVPIDHWAYPLLERLVARGLLELDLTTLPVSRSAVAAALAERAGRGVGEAAGGARETAGDAPGRGRRRAEARPSEREEWALGLLAGEFLHGRVDRPLLEIEGGEAVLGVGIRLGSEMAYRSAELSTAVEDQWWPSERGDGAPSSAPALGAGDVAVDAGGSDDELELAADLRYELWGGAGDHLGFYAESIILLEQQDGPRSVKLSSRARTWRGFSVSAHRAYVKYERASVDVAVGRRGPAWGRSRWGRLLISGGAPTFDGLEARFRVGPLTVQALHVFVERLDEPEVGARADESLEGGGVAGLSSRDGSQTFLAAHRAVVAGTWGSVGVGEAVVYSGDIPDPAYVNPLLPYYVSQHNERADDNVLWSLDFTARPVRGLEAWGEFLVDDLQYDRDTGHPDKYGLTLGASYFGTVSSRDWELTCEYTNVRKWTYTHHVATHDYTHDGLPIGFDLGPDADRTTVELVYHPSAPWGLKALYSFSRRGEGSASEPFVTGENPEPAFPSGDVEYGHRVGLSLEYADPGTFAASLGGAFVRGWSDLRDDDSYEFWARVQFRI